jgi:4-amino-4-deoxy-L-arabinose transferase-like glycosyltransferase
VRAPRDAQRRFAFKDTLQTWRLTPSRGVLFGILVIALGVRLWSLDAGVPFAVDPDEPSMVKRVLRILGTGDWNPHIFDAPPLVTYLHAAIALLRFMAGASRGEWASLDHFDTAAVYGAGRTVTAMVGAATVWLVYRMGREAVSERVGLLAAALLAVLPVHVRDSHFMLANVPLTALTTLAVYLAMRMEQTRPWLAGAAAGLAAAAGYGGALVIVAAVIASFIRREPMALRLQACGIALFAAASAFLLATPYVFLDLPTFLNSFAVEMARLAAARRAAPAGWMTSLTALAESTWVWLLFAVAGIVIIGTSLTRRAGRVRWLPVLGFTLLFSVVLARYATAAARHALPMAPILCLAAAVGIDGLARLLTSVPVLRRHALRVVVPIALALTVLVPFGDDVVDWQRQLERRDTREVVTDWMRGSLPRKTRIAVEKSGPSHLDQAGFDVIEVDRLASQPPHWYAEQKIEYLVVSSGEAWAAGYADAGIRMVDVPSLPNRPGPSMRVIRVSSP